MVCQAEVFIRPKFEVAPYNPALPADLYAYCAELTHLAAEARDLDRGRRFAAIVSRCHPAILYAIVEGVVGLGSAEDPHARYFVVTTAAAVLVRALLHGDPDDGFAAQCSRLEHINDLITVASLANLEIRCRALGVSVTWPADPLDDAAQIGLGDKGAGSLVLHRTVASLGEA